MDILVVEDNVHCIQAIGGIIARLGYNVENADTCKEALEKVRQERFDLILLDIFLPDGKGHQLIPELKELWPEVGIVTMTGHNSRELEMEVRKQGIIYYMIKPFQTEDLKSLLEHLSQKHSERIESETQFQFRK
ncbi:MAG: response regulator, partial [Deltaproteobacteria bacterium]|nr:response regulator [Deltaproteobacteria bacterium]MBW2341292.1 response regulator [Deltaproteobacteria bacterium]